MGVDMGYSSWVGWQTHQSRHAKPEDGPEARFVGEKGSFTAVVEALILDPLQHLGMSHCDLQSVAVASQAVIIDLDLASERLADQIALVIQVVKLVAVQPFKAGEVGLDCDLLDQTVVDTATAGQQAVMFLDVVEASVRLQCTESHDLSTLQKSADGFGSSEDD